MRVSAFGITFFTILSDEILIGLIINQHKKEDLFVLSGYGIYLNEI